MLRSAGSRLLDHDLNEIPALHVANIPLGEIACYDAGHLSGARCTNGGGRGPVAPPVFKTGLLSQPAKIANKALGFSRPR